MSGPCDACGSSRSGCPYCIERPTPWSERAISPSEVERIRGEVAAGRCVLPANACGWDCCTKHHPVAS